MARARLVTVFTSGDPAVIAVAKSLLEAAKIEFFAKGDSLQNVVAPTVGTGFSPVVGPVELQVRNTDREEAAELLQKLRDEEKKVRR